MATPPTPLSTLRPGQVGNLLALVVAIATFFSAFTTPMLAAFFTTGTWLLGQLTRDLRDIGANSEVASIERTTALLHRLLPDLESFNLLLTELNSTGLENEARGIATQWQPIEQAAQTLERALALAADGSAAQYIPEFRQRRALYRQGKAFVDEN